jgi:hypothetical protein
VVYAYHEHIEVEVLYIELALEIEYGVETVVLDELRGSLLHLIFLIELGCTEDHLYIYIEYNLITPI